MHFSAKEAQASLLHCRDSNFGNIDPNHWTRPGYDSRDGSPSLEMDIHSEFEWHTLHAMTMTALILSRTSLSQPQFMNTAFLTHNSTSQTWEYGWKLIWEVSGSLNYLKKAGGDEERSVLSFTHSLISAHSSFMNHDRHHASLCSFNRVESVLG